MQKHVQLDFSTERAMQQNSAVDLLLWVDVQSMCIIDEVKSFLIEILRSGLLL